jgi:hypothetical protein
MKLYHGTQPRNRRSIEEESFLGSELSEFTDGFTHIEDGVVYMTDSFKEAQLYGGCVFEIDWLEEDQVFSFSDGNTNHFYARASYINEECTWEVVEE